MDGSEGDVPTLPRSHKSLSGGFPGVEGSGWSSVDQSETMSKQEEVMAMGYEPFAEWVQATWKRIREERVELCEVKIIFRRAVRACPVSHGQ